ncbi:hypothetical protein HPO96_03145 [Kribbella sandramycini]|uniref:DUF5648 domain-containing protein n=1 Tax=Kribbella sandramycini TaxID=60450 RepID=A0A7Y4KV57_9ACTN|nr:hypothetical protein [Kribbella sandramycini]NOL39232.1 hypothetical protein [Kribbella sandramycini]
MRRTLGLLVLSAALLASTLVLTGEKPATAAIRPTHPQPLVELVAPHGTGRLYTADPQELDAATAAGYRRQPGALAAVDREPKAGSIPLYRLKPTTNATRWLFTTSPDERDTLVRKGWTDEDIAGYVNAEPAPGLVQLRRFTNGKEWRLALEPRTAELLKAGYTLDGPVGYVRPTAVRAGAVYFGMFHTGGHPTIIGRTKEIYGRDNDWWGGVRDFHAGTPYATDNWPGTDWSNLKPSIGYYDDSQPATLEKHIEQATSAGLSFFNFYYYWDSKKQRQDLTDAALEAFLQASNKDSIDFTIGVCAHPYAPLNIPVAQYDAVATNLARYLQQDNVLRTNDGRKILNVCDARGLGDGSNAQIKQFVDAVRAKSGQDLYVMINQAGFDPKQVANAGAEAPYCTTDGPAIESRSYATYLRDQTKFYHQAPTGPFGRCVLADFDERPRYPIENPNVDAIRWMPDQSIDSFRQAVRTAVADMNASTRPSTVDNHLYLYAWNEWHEGGVIEPNERDGCAYLDVLQAELSLPGPGCVG